MYCNNFLNIIALSAFLSACNPFYVIRAGYEESQILLGREEISEIIEKDQASGEEKEKLALVLSAREFGKSLGLTPGDSFTQYSRLDRDVAAWVLLGSRTDAFEPYTWWFPIVGSVPYKGFFSKEAAKHAAWKLEHKGYETWVRGADAFSTLGWFNDPVLSTTLKRHPIEIVNTVLHESVHATFWIEGDVAFNETLANFVGHQATIQYYQDKDQNLYDLAKKVFSRERFLAKTIEQLFIELNTLYQSKRTKEEILAEREDIFIKHTKEMHARYPQLTILHTVNNAEIMQLKLYLTEFEKFVEIYERVENDWGQFFVEIKKDGAKSG